MYVLDETYPNYQRLKKRTESLFVLINLQERKQLLKGSFRDRHFNAGSILLGFGVLESVGGGINTWMRTGKLFPGPHLFAGAGIFLFVT